MNRNDQDKRRYDEIVDVVLRNALITNLVTFYASVPSEQEIQRFHRFSPEFERRMETIFKECRRAEKENAQAPEQNGMEEEKTAVFAQLDQSFWEDWKQSHTDRDETGGWEDAGEDRDEVFFDMLAGERSTEELLAEEMLKQPWFAEGLCSETLRQGGMTEEDLFFRKLIEEDMRLRERECAQEMQALERERALFRQASASGAPAASNIQNIQTEQPVSPVGVETEYLNVEDIANVSTTQNIENIKTADCKPYPPENRGDFAHGEKRSEAEFQRGMVCGRQEDGSAAQMQPDTNVAQAQENNRMAQMWPDGSTVQSQADESVVLDQEDTSAVLIQSDDVKEEPMAPQTTVPDNVILFAEKVEKKGKRKWRFKRPVKIAAAVVVVGFIFGLNGLMFNPIRASFRQTILNYEGQGYIVSNTSEDDYHVIFRDPSYIPKGYNNILDYENDTVKTLIYTNESNDLLIEYSLFEENLDLGYDNERHVINGESVLIKKKYEALYFSPEENSSTKILAWQNGMVQYKIWGVEPLEDLIKIAESIMK